MFSRAFGELPYYLSSKLSLKNEGDGLSDLGDERDRGGVLIQDQSLKIAVESLEIPKLTSSKKPS